MEIPKKKVNLKTMDQIDDNELTVLIESLKKIKGFEFFGSVKLVGHCLTCQVRDMWFFWFDTSVILTMRRVHIHVKTVNRSFCGV